MNPTTTGGVAITTAALGGLIIWGCGAVLHVEAPPDAVAGTMAALLMYAAHGAVAAFKAYFPPKAKPTAPAQ
jgi:hypothetical protein